MAFLCTMKKMQNSKLGCGLCALCQKCSRVATAVSCHSQSFSLNKDNHNNHVVLMLACLHWFPVSVRIHLIIYKPLHGQAFDYISALLTSYWLKKPFTSLDQAFQPWQQTIKLLIYRHYSFITSSSLFWSAATVFVSEFLLSSPCMRWYL